MKITIDTKIDSKEEIRKAIVLLQNIISAESTEIYTNLPSESNFLSSQQPEQPSSTSTPPASPDVLGDFFSSIPSETSVPPNQESSLETLNSPQVLPEQPKEPPIKVMEYY